eukprot:gnl/TRDRNA2_/TRDRNA2_84228_c1_seq1.p1 gnl/TRDRNA2_/TRDRNA2_84228_c1~~gnl/TRDRNA2_/TRDRNA2_84228_c1_seq1.p1  ORF type:complete len:104 (-),score=46.23 gnl/TRDRNA2_/TRDRNA2_84228_c1_seq1:334-645(-)
MTKPPCNVETLENCSKKEKQFIEDMKGWDEATIEEKYTSMKTALESARKMDKDLQEQFEKEKEIAMATMKKQEEAKTASEELTKNTQFKIKILQQKVPQKAEL